MKVVVDTSVWSLALRRNRILEESPQILRLRELIADNRVALLGAIRQEVLSGIREVEQFVHLREYLRAFPNLELVVEDDELAAEFYNTCRRNGIQGSNIDFLICAVAHRRGYGLLTTDGDFVLFGEHLPIILWQ
ncbi:MAG: PIN domain-containing protein [Leptolyngbyaceae cyanobacterium SU_3_3]|nr:PIN domain-containing protein [Leptolyngbyaceae cyanobacterium SU_3_3]